MDFVLFKKFNSTLRAETFGNLLEQNDIEHQIKNLEAVMGQANSPAGTGLWVPSEKLQAAHDILDGLISSGEISGDDLQDHE